MKLDITFICETCLIYNRKIELWTEHDNWTYLDEAVAHLKNNPDHKISAEAEISL